MLSKLQSWIRCRVDIPTRLGLGPQGWRWSCPPPWLGLRALPWLCAWAPLGTPAEAGNHSPVAHVLFRQLRRRCQLYLFPLEGRHLSPRCPGAAGAPRRQLRRTAGVGSRAWVEGSPGSVHRGPAGAKPSLERARSYSALPLGSFFPCAAHQLPGL